MITEPYSDLTPMPFGKHVGVKLANVPAQYLVWLYESSENGKRLSDARLAKYIGDNLQGLRMEIISNNQQKKYERR